MRTVVCWDLVGWGERWFDWGDALGGDKTGFFGRECWVLPRWKFYEWETTRFYEFALSVARRKKSPSRSLRAVALRDLRGGESPSLFDLAHATLRGNLRFGCRIPNQKGEHLVRLGRHHEKARTMLRHSTY